MVTIEDLYKYVGVLTDAKEKAGQHEKEYKLILAAVKTGGANEKRLASQFIARFFKYFPALADTSLDAMFDLCEDDDVGIRKQAISDLPSLCRDNADHLPRVADVLTQLLQAEDQTELSLVHKSLGALLKTNAKGTLGGLFSQILQGDEVIRERAIAFIGAKLKLLADELLTKEVEEFLVTQCKKVLEDVTGEEFVVLMKVLTALPSMNSLQGRQQLLDIVTEQAELEATFEAKNPDCVDRLEQCSRQALPLFSKNVHSNKFVDYILLQVMPVLPDIGLMSGSGEGAAPASDIQLRILKLLAELVGFCNELANPEVAVTNVFNVLLTYMPLPDADTAEASVPKLQFSHVECLMYTFHQVARLCPQVLTSEKHAARLRDFRIRLQYFARGVQVYIKQLTLALQGKSGDALKTDENKIKVIALKTTSNINTLIKDLFHNPPAYKAVIILSFKMATTPKPAKPEPTTGEKRFTPITFGSSDAPDKKTNKTDRKVYSPPSGKFSEKAGPFPAGGGEGGTGGNWRGGGGARRGWRGGNRGNGGGRFRRW